MEINKIHNEDCLETMKKMNDDFVDLVVTSPPYNIGDGRRNGKNKSVLKYDNYDDNLDLNDYFEKVDQWINELYRVTKYHVFFNIQEIANNKGVIKHIYENHSDKIKHVFFWIKNNPPSPINDTGIAKAYEHIFCFSKDNPTKSTFNYCNFSNKKGDYMKNIIIKPVNSDQETKGHNFAFGDWLPKHFIHYFSKEGCLVYDPFMGTGTTAKASHVLKRNWIGSEISPKYVELSNKRLKPYLNQLTMF